MQFDIEQKKFEKIEKMKSNPIIVSLRKEDGLLMMKLSLELAPQVRRFVNLNVLLSKRDVEVTTKNEQHFPP